MEGKQGAAEDRWMVDRLVEVLGRASLDVICGESLGVLPLSLPLSSSVVLYAGLA